MVPIYQIELGASEEGTHSKFPLFSYTHTIFISSAIVQSVLNTYTLCFFRMAVLYCRVGWLLLSLRTGYLLLFPKPGWLLLWGRLWSGAILGQHIPSSPSVSPRPPHNAAHCYSISSPYQVQVMQSLNLPTIMMDGNKGFLSITSYMVCAKHHVAVASSLMWGSFQ